MNEWRSSSSCVGRACVRIVRMLSHWFIYYFSRKKMKNPAGHWANDDEVFNWVVSLKAAAAAAAVAVLVQCEILGRQPRRQQQLYPPPSLSSSLFEILEAGGIISLCKKKTKKTKNADHPHDDDDDEKKKKKKEENGFRRSCELTMRWFNRNCLNSQ